MFLNYSNLYIVKTTRTHASIRNEILKASRLSRLRPFATDQWIKNTTKWTYSSSGLELILLDNANICKTVSYYCVVFQEYRVYLYVNVKAHVICSPA